MDQERKLTFAYTPDSDDAFYYDALETRQVTMPWGRSSFIRESVHALNQAALRGKHDVTAVSSVIYPEIADRYAILSVGTSVGRGYGPVLVSKDARSLADLRKCRIGVPGIPTTGWFLLRWLCPEAIPVELPFDQIADAVAARELVAGVMIHEELLYYPRIGLNCVLDLGAEWCRQFDLPLPVGLNVIRRDLGMTLMHRVCAALRRSLEYALDHSDEVLARVSRFGRGASGQCTDQFVAMFANQDSLRMPADVRKALRVLFSQVVELGLGPTVPRIDIIEGSKRGWVTPKRQVA